MSQIGVVTRQSAPGSETEEADFRTRIDAIRAARMTVLRSIRD